MKVIFNSIETRGTVKYLKLLIIIYIYLYTQILQIIVVFINYLTFFDLRLI